MKTARQDHCAVCVTHYEGTLRQPHTQHLGTRANIPLLGHGYVTLKKLLVKGQYLSPSHYFMRLISYLQCFFGSLSREIALLPQGHLKKLLMASCQR